MEYPSILSLSLANDCVAHCAWCPVGRREFKGRRNRYMTMSVVDKIIKDTRLFPIQEIWVSENGEGLMNPNFKAIIFKLAEAFKKVPFYLATNFALLDKYMSEYLLRMGFVWISGNIDGATQETYGAVKGLDLERVKTNFRDLLINAKRINPAVKIGVNILTLRNYKNQIGEECDLPDDTRDTFRMVRDIAADVQMDMEVFTPVALSWAERRKWQRPKTDKICAGLGSITKKLFFDTDGNVYPCCLDFDSEYSYGNILEETAAAIWNGERRKRFISLMADSNWAEIGQPCIWCAD